MNKRDKSLQLMEMLHFQQEAENRMIQTVTALQADDEELNATEIEDKKRLLQTLADTVHETSNVMMTKVAEVYENTYSVEELDEIITFYKSPVGHKMANTSNEFTAKTLKIGEEWGLNIWKMVQIKMGWA